MGLTPVRGTATWQALAEHQAKIKGVHLREMFAGDPGRAERFTVSGAGLTLDYSKNRITDETMQLLVAPRRGARGGCAKARRDVPRRQDQRHREPRGAARRAARAEATP